MSVTGWHSCHRLVPPPPLPFSSFFFSSLVRPHCPPPCLCGFFRQALRVGPLLRLEFSHHPTCPNSCHRCSFWKIACVLVITDAACLSAVLLHVTTLKGTRGGKRRRGEIQGWGRVSLSRGANRGESEGRIGRKEKQTHTRILIRNLSPVFFKQSLVEECACGGLILGHRGP